MLIRETGTTEKREGDTIEVSRVTHIDRKELETQRDRMVAEKAVKLAEALDEARTRTDGSYDAKIAEMNRLLAIG